MIDPTIIKILFKTLFLLLLLLSFYIFIIVLLNKNSHYKDIFSTWQFPMLLALAVDLYIIV